MVFHYHVQREELLIVVQIVPPGPGPRRPR
jgi:hypothetical protein